MIEIVFITSSKEKLAHARYLCRDYNVFISKQKQYGISYIEPRVSDRKELLDNSIKDAYKRWKKTISKPDEKFFFIEDTSVNIPALSPDGNEFPGLDIKFWMRRNNFVSIDEQLKGVGNDRTAIVRSDVALVLSIDLQSETGELYKTFTSHVKGSIIESELKLETQPYYSWLSGKTFNKWFVPDGCDLPLSALPIGEADEHDFRAGAFQEMLNFLEAHGKIRKRADLFMVKQIGIFSIPIFVVCGPTCAGKTTLAEFLVNDFGFFHLEASDFMYLRFYEHHGVGSSIKIGDFAQAALKTDPCIVADQILHELNKIEFTGIVITGFRSPQEIICFKQKYKGDYNIIDLFIDAPIASRFERSKLRNREGSKPYEVFIADNKQQEIMGIEQLRILLSESTIKNESTLDKYFKDFSDRYVNNIQGFIKNKTADEPVSKARLEELIMLALLKESKSNSFYSTTEIATLIKKHFPGISKNKNNVSRYFNQNYHPYYDLKIREGVTTYRLSQTGCSKASLLSSNFYLDNHK